MISLFMLESVLVLNKYFTKIVGLDNYHKYIEDIGRKLLPFEEAQDLINSLFKNREVKSIEIELEKVGKRPQIEIVSENDDFWWVNIYEVMPNHRTNRGWFRISKKNGKTEKVDPAKEAGKHAKELIKMIEEQKEHSRNATLKIARKPKTKVQVKYPESRPRRLSRP